MKSHRLKTDVTNGLRINIADARAHDTQPALSLPRIYALRIAYLIVAVGLGVVVWPNVIHHTNEFAVSNGVRFSLLAGIGAMAAWGLRYPVRMLPLLLFEVSWKAIYLIAFALPLWALHQMTAAVAENVYSVLAVVILLPLIPWRYVFTHYVVKPADRWK